MFELEEARRWEHEQKGMKRKSKTKRKEKENINEYQRGARVWCLFTVSRSIKVWTRVRGGGVSTHQCERRNPNRSSVDRTYLHQRAR